MRRVASLLTLALLAGCSAGGDDAIAVIPKGTTHEFWKAIHAGAARAEQELGVKIIWQGPLKEDDRQEQIKVVENFTNRRVRGIVLAPLDDAALRAPVAAAQRVGIPVVIIDSDLASEDYVSFVATDNRAAGGLAGEHLASLVGDSGRVALLRYQEGSASTANRERGFLEAIARHPGIRVVSDNQYAGATTETATAASENLLARFRSPDGQLGLDGVFCPNESSVFGMLIALRGAGLAGRVKLVGFDSSPRLVEALAAGELHGTVMQDPVTMGYLGVKTLVDHLAGKATPRRIDTGATLATRDNMSEPRVKELLSPDLDRWLKP